VTMPNLGKLFGSNLFSGALIHYAPQVLKGFMKEYLGQLKFQETVEWIAANKSLWQEMDPKFRKSLIEFGPKLGPMEWFTTDWTIEAGAQTNPAVASLIMGWPEGYEWLTRQIEDLKSHIKEGA
jgi:hypothetical protein